MASSRIYKFDNLKFLLIVFVVIGHMADYYSGWSGVTAYAVTRQFIYGFHMPLFVLLSGLFYKDKDIPVKVFRFLCCAVGMTIVNSLTKVAFGIHTTPNIIKIGGVTWYLYALAFFYILRHLLRDVNPRLLLLFSVTVMVLIGFTDVLGNVLALTRVFVFFPFFVLGTMFDRDRLLAVTEKRWIRLAGLAVIIGWGIFIVLNARHLRPVRLLYNAGKAAYAGLPDKLAPYGVLLRLLWLLLALVLGLALIAIVPNRKLPLVSVFGARTLQVYFWHSPIILALNYSGIAEQMSASHTTQLLYLLCGAVIAVVLSLKPFSFPVNQINQYAKKPESK